VFLSPFPLHQLSTSPEDPPLQAWIILLSSKLSITFLCPWKACDLDFYVCRKGERRKIWFPLVLEVRGTCEVWVKVQESSAQVWRRLRPCLSLETFF
jgi:hypothetical protein